MKNSAIIFVQARTGSTRLPNKCLKPASLPFFKKPRPMLAFLLDNLVLCKLPIVITVPHEDKNTFKKFLTSYCGERKQLYNFSGKQHFFCAPLPPISVYSNHNILENDVLSRFLKAAETYDAANYIRVTGDNPFTCATNLISILKNHIIKKASISYYNGLPYGTGVEVISKQTLFAMNLAKNSAREHLTTYAYKNAHKFLINAPLASKRFCAPHLRLTVDTKEDWLQFTKIMQKIYSRLTANQTEKVNLEKEISLVEIIKQESKK